MKFNLCILLFLSLRYTTQRWASLIPAYVELVYLQSRDISCFCIVPYFIANYITSPFLDTVQFTYILFSALHLIQFRKLHFCWRVHDQVLAAICVNSYEKLAFIYKIYATLSMWSPHHLINRLHLEKGSIGRNQPTAN